MYILAEPAIAVDGVFYDKIEGVKSRDEENSSHEKFAPPHGEVTGRDDLPTIGG